LADATPHAHALKKNSNCLWSRRIVSSNDTLNAGPRMWRCRAQAWGRNSGNVTNSERRISRQRAVLAPKEREAGLVDRVSEIAHGLGFGAAFAFGISWRIVF